nr:hypothetical protein [Rhizobium leguminosarum]
MANKLCFARRSIHWFPFGLRVPQNLAQLAETFDLAGTLRAEGIAQRLPIAFRKADPLRDIRPIAALANSSSGKKIGQQRNSTG